MKWNKKGNMFDSVLIIMILLVVFFMLANGLTSEIDGVIDFAPDSTQRFMLNLFVPFLLLGILRVVFSRGVAGQ